MNSDFIRGFIGIIILYVCIALCTVVPSAMPFVRSLWSRGNGVYMLLIFMALPFFVSVLLYTLGLTHR
jgi:hypothetical protein